MAAPATDCPRHFWLLLWNSWREFKESWQKARTQCTLPSLYFSGDWKNKMAAPASYWLREFQFLLWNCRTEFDEICKEARPQRPLPSLCFWANWKFKMVAPAYDWLRHLRLLLRNRWMELKETWLEAISQCSLPTFCLLGPVRKTQMAAPVSDWLIHFRLLLWNRWTAFNETWSQCPLPSSNCFWWNGKPRWPPRPINQQGWHIVLRCTICGPLGLLFSAYDSTLTFFICITRNWIFWSFKYCGMRPF